MSNHKCPSCNKGELIATSEGLGQTWITYSCGHEERINKCVSCGKLMDLTKEEDFLVWSCDCDDKKDVSEAEGEQ